VAPIYNLLANTKDRLAGKLAENSDTLSEETVMAV
jgi:hypothetical protein